MASVAMLTTVLSMFLQVFMRRRSKMADFVIKPTLDCSGWIKVL